MKRLIRLCILLHVVILQYGVIFCSSANHLCHHDEGLALLRFKELLNVNPFSMGSAFCYNSGQQSYPKIKSWNESRDCCNWDGVTCHDLTGHIIGLDLSCSQIEGAISPNSSLFHLSQLQN